MNRESMYYLFKRSRTKRPNSTKAWKRTLHTNNCFLLLKTLGFWLLFIPNTTHSFANLLTHCAKCLGMVHRSFTSGFIYDLTHSNCSCRVLRINSGKIEKVCTIIFKGRGQKDQTALRPENVRYTLTTVFCCWKLWVFGYCLSPTLLTPLLIS